MRHQQSLQKSFRRQALRKLLPQSLRLENALPLPVRLSGFFSAALSVGVATPGAASASHRAIPAKGTSGEACESMRNSIFFVVTGFNSLQTGAMRNKPFEVPHSRVSFKPVLSLYQRSPDRFVILEIGLCRFARERSPHRCPSRSGLPTAAVATCCRVLYFVCYRSGS